MSAKRWIVAILIATAVSLMVPNPALILTSPSASSDQNGEAIVLKSTCPWKQSAFAALQTRGDGQIARRGCADVDGEIVFFTWESGDTDLASPAPPGVASFRHRPRPSLKGSRSD
jgi:hypothetical protein